MAQHRLLINQREGRVRLLVDGQLQGYLGGKAELTPKLLDSLVASYVRRARAEGHVVIVDEEGQAAA
jgi:hypothetical protein